MTLLGALALACAALGFARRRPQVVAVALGFGAGVPASAGVVLGGTAVPVFTSVGFVAAGMWVSGRQRRPTGAVTAVLVAFAAWAVAITVLAPWAFAGTPVLEPRGGIDEQIGAMTPLGFTSSNVAQAGYLVVAVFAVLFLASTGTARTAMSVAAWTGIGLSTVRNLLRSLGTDPLAPVFETMVAAYASPGDPRMRGVFTEPSELAVFALAVSVAAVVTAATTSGRRRTAALVLAALAIGNLVASAAGTAVVAAGVVAALGLVVVLVRTIARDGRGVAWLVLGGITVASARLAFGDSLLEPMQQVVQGKVGSQSYDSRTAADAIGMRVTGETLGFGSGLGSNRSSSFAVTMLSTVGVPGAALFLITVVLAGRAAVRNRATVPALATLVAILVAKVISAPDLSTPLLWVCLAACIPAAAGPTASPIAPAPGRRRAAR